MGNKLYLIYLYNFKKKTYEAQNTHFYNEQDALHYCLLSNLNFIFLDKKDLYFHIEYGKDLTEEDLNKMLKEYAVFYRSIAFKIVERCNDVRDSLKEEE